MVSGDSWSTSGGFQISKTSPSGSPRATRASAYRDRNATKLEKFYAREAKARVSLKFVQRWLDRFHSALPLPARMAFIGHPVHFVLSKGDEELCFELDFYSGQAQQVDHAPGGARRLEVHTSAFIFKQCCALDLFSHLQISKRVKFKVTKATKARMQLLNFLWELYDYDYLPLDEVHWDRMAETWALRWRELGLWGRIFSDIAAGRGFDQDRWIRSARPELTAGSSPS